MKIQKIQAVFSAGAWCANNTAWPLLGKFSISRFIQKESALFVFFNIHYTKKLRILNISKYP